jgi:hypothetical protein
VTTTLEFEGEDDQADALAEAFARSLKREGGWDADFRVGDATTSSSLRTRSSVTGEVIETVALS